MTERGIATINTIIPHPISQYPKSKDPEFGPQNGLMYPELYSEANNMILVQYKIKEMNVTKEAMIAKGMEMQHLQQK
eukprot:Awhi_evm1s11280